MRGRNNLRDFVRIRLFGADARDQDIVRSAHSRYIIDAHTSNHDLASRKFTPVQSFGYALDIVGLVNAMLFRIQALAPPIQTLVLTGP